MPVLKAGKSAPPFALNATDGKSYSLQEGLKHGPVLAAFFKVNCPTASTLSLFWKGFISNYAPVGCKFGEYRRTELRIANASRGTTQ